MTVKVKFFARYAELFGQESVTLDFPGDATVSDVVQTIRARWPAHSELPAQPMVALNMRHASPGDAVSDGDELALLPPLAGG